MDRVGGEGDQAGGRPGPGQPAGGVSGHYGGYPGRAGRQLFGQAGGLLCDGTTGRPGPQGGGRLRPGRPGHRRRAEWAAQAARGGHMPGGGAGQPGHYPRRHRARGGRPHHGHPPSGGAGTGALRFLPAGSGLGRRSAGHHRRGERRTGKGGSGKDPTGLHHRGGRPGLPIHGPGVHHRTVGQHRHCPRLRRGQPPGRPQPGDLRRPRHCRGSTNGSGRRDVGRRYSGGGRARGAGPGGPGRGGRRADGHAQRHRPAGGRPGQGHRVRDQPGASAWLDN